MRMAISAVTVMNMNILIHICMNTRIPTAMSMVTKKNMIIPMKITGKTDAADVRPDAEATVMGMSTAMRCPASRIR